MDSDVELYDFRTGDELSDLKLIVENQILYVHKAILGASSRVFRRMLTLNFKESVESEIRLPDKKLDDILELLKMIYPNYPKIIDDSKIQILLELSEEYLITNLKQIIEKNLINKVQQMKLTKMYGKEIENRIDFLIDLINLSLNFNLKNLKAASIETLATHFNKKQLELNKSFQENLKHDSIKLEIYSKKLDLLQEKLNLAEIKLKKYKDDSIKEKYRKTE